MIDVAKALLEAKAVHLRPQRPFTWASGIMSPIYCDNRLLMSYPPYRKRITEGFVRLCEGTDFDVIAGTATSGIPFAAWLSDKLDKPMIYVRGSQKEHGLSKQIEGVIPSKKKVLVIEDLISTGGSVLKVCDILQNNGANVVGVVAIFSYLKKGVSQKFSNIGIPLKTLSDIDELLVLAQDLDYISPSQYQEIQVWRSQNLS